jgi:hypothetical protein
MRWLNLNPPLGFCITPAPKDAAAWQEECIYPAVVDDG